MFVWRTTRHLFGQRSGNTLRQCHSKARLQHGNGTTAALPSAKEAHSTMSDGRASSLHDATASFSASHRSGFRQGDDLPASVVSLPDTDTPDSEPGGRLQSAEELLRRRAQVLCVAAEAELQAEVERDSRDGVAAIPPLPPSGWKVQHPAGSNFFIMSRTLYGGAASAELNTRRYQSVHDVFLQAVKRGPKRELSRDARKHTTGGSGSGGNSGGAANGVSHSDKSRKKVLIGYDADRGRRSVLEEMGAAHDSCHGVERADMHLTVFAPFYVYDPSSHDPSVDICEWAAFDLLVQKTAAKTNRNTGENPLDSLPHLVEDGALCMFVRLASVNSEMRIRSIQLLSRRESQALAEHAYFGRGEPMFLELMSHRRHTGTTFPPHRAVQRYDDPLMHANLTPHSATTSLKGAFSASISNSSGEMRSSAYELLVHCFDSGGEYGRTLCYGGPYVSELSKEMVEALQEYLQGDLGISAALCEYVCQMQFFLEQEEYMGWLGQLRHLASVASKNV